MCIPTRIVSGGWTRMAPGESTVSTTTIWCWPPVPGSISGRGPVWVPRLATPGPSAHHPMRSRRAITSLPPASPSRPRVQYRPLHQSQRPAYQPGAPSHWYGLGHHRAHCGAQPGRPGPARPFDPQRTHDRDVRRSHRLAGRFPVGRLRRRDHGLSNRAGYAPLSQRGRSRPVRHPDGDGPGGRV